MGKEKKGKACNLDKVVGTLTQDSEDLAPPGARRPSPAPLLARRKLPSRSGRGRERGGWEHAAVRPMYSSLFPGEILASCDVP